MGTQVDGTPLWGSLHTVLKENRHPNTFTTPRDKEVCDQGIIAFSRLYPLALLPLSLARLFELCMLVLLLFLVLLYI